ncbi:MAG: M12 family metallo-peptidase [Bacteroidia bacterium]|nr:M12 family metallo-peptidase [Bacteroidia bacterium]
MRIIRLFFISLTGLILTLEFLHAQADKNLWTKISEAEIPNRSGRVIIPENYRTFRLNKSALDQKLSQAPMEFTPAAANPTEIKLPMPDGSFERFSIVESPVMAPELAAKYPEIKTYSGKGIDNPTAYIRMDKTPKGFHAIVLSAAGSVLIDPYGNNTVTEYISYWKKDAADESKEGICGVEEDDLPISLPENATEGIEGELLTYRLAMAADSGYTSFHGGTVGGAMAAIATVLNQVNAIYESEVSIRMVLVPNNDLLIYTGADPYTNGSLGTMLQQNQNAVDAAIGNSNYDIGHVLSQANPQSGVFVAGIAQLASVCGGGKARGASSLPAPVGGAFAGIVAHEMGHQFSANHTFNTNAASCIQQRNPSTAYEPGSGSTIMAYPSACSPQNIQNSRDLFFHNSAYSEIVNYTRNGSGSSCPVILSVNNQSPVVIVPSGGFFIPKETPFQLTGSATDPDGDALTYSWEEFDLGPAGDPNSPSGNAPLFRSYPPSSSSTRVFPLINAIIANVSVYGEKLPSYSRDLKFRMTVRDNHPGGAGVEFGQVAFQATANAGPFLVTHPNTNAPVWIAGNWEDVTWDVAKTNISPINCVKVNILMSTDGGFTYPLTLAEDVLNTGFATVRVPENPGFKTRIKVEAADNIFFDISNQDFEVKLPASPGFSYYFPADTLKVCAPNQAVFQIVTSSLLGFNSPISLTTTNLPAGAVASFSQSTSNTNDTTLLTISNTNNITAGVYAFNLVGTATTGEVETRTLVLEVKSEVPSSVILGSPQNGGLAVVTTPTFFWAPFPGDNDYKIDIATNPAFISGALAASAVKKSNNFTPASPLAPLTIYYWRVNASNVCGTGQPSEIRAFQTAGSGNPPANPSFGTNLPLSVLKWKSELITPVFLSVSDGVSTPPNLTYTLVTTPGHGGILLNALPLGVGASFTQDDINTGKVKYQHNGDNAIADNFFFTVKNSAGGLLAMPVFNIVITQTTDIGNEIPGAKVTVFPNPADDRVEIKLEGDWGKEVIVNLLDINGQIITKETIRAFAGNFSAKMDVSGLASGVYMIRVISDRGSLIQKFLIE